jgi:hypothetical protein
MSEFALETRLVDDESARRYELYVGNDLAGYINYRDEPGTRVLVHTDIAPAFEGRGLGSVLVMGALDDIRERGLYLTPLCPFVARYVRRHPEYQELVAADPDRGD